MIKINDVSSFSQSPIIGSLPNLDVTRTGLNAQMSSTLGRIGSFSLELFAHVFYAVIFLILIIKKMMSPLFFS